VVVAVPGARVALVPDLPRMGSAELVATAEMLANRAMAATVPMVTRQPLMAEPVEMAATPAWLDWEAWADLDQLLALTVRTEPPRHPAAMEGTAVMDLLRCSQANLEAMAELEEPVDHSETEAMGDSAAMAQSGRPE